MHTALLNGQLLKETNYDAIVNSTPKPAHFGEAIEVSA